MSTWRVHAFDLEAMTADFPFARSLIVVRSERTLKKTGQGSVESRSYLSSRAAGEHTSAQWLGLIRGHWAGVENRNHWRRDALMGEDRSRSRNAQPISSAWPIAVQLGFRSTSSFFDSLSSAQTSQ